MVHAAASSALGSEHVLVDLAVLHDDLGVSDGLSHKHVVLCRIQKPNV